LDFESQIARPITDREMRSEKKSSLDRVDAHALDTFMSLSRRLRTWLVESTAGWDSDFLAWR
jgi:hypothetical protein